MENFTFASTFISGFESLIEKAFSFFGIKADITYLTDGFVIYRHNDIDSILNCPFFSNSFIIIKNFKNDKNPSFNSLLKSFINDKRAVSFVCSFINANESFRLVFSDKNTLVKVDENLKKSAEKVISNQGFKINRLSPDKEIWFYKRSDESSYIMIRLTYQKTADSRLFKGELREEAAFFLCLMSQGKEFLETIIDPFCGYSSIARQYAEFFKCGNFMSGDIEKEVLLAGKEKFISYFQKEKQNFSFIKADFLNSGIYKNNFANAIITDPPWGSFQEMDINGFYDSFFKKAKDVLKENGIIILLHSRGLDIQPFIEKYSLMLEYSLNVLISGKKAIVSKLTI